MQALCRHSQLLWVLQCDDHEDTQKAAFHKTSSLFQLLSFFLVSSSSMFTESWRGTYWSSFRTHFSTVSIPWPATSFCLHQPPLELHKQASLTKTNKSTSLWLEIGGSLTTCSFRKILKSEFISAAFDSFLSPSLRPWLHAQHQDELSWLDLSQL